MVGSPRPHPPPSLYGEMARHSARGNGERVARVGGEGGHMPRPRDAGARREGGPLSRRGQGLPHLWWAVEACRGKGSSDGWHSSAAKWSWTGVRQRGRCPSGARLLPPCRCLAPLTLPPRCPDSEGAELETRRLCSVVRGDEETGSESRDSAFSQLVNILREARGALRAGKGSAGAIGSGTPALRPLRRHPRLPGLRHAGPHKMPIQRMCMTCIRQVGAAPFALMLRHVGRQRSQALPRRFRSSRSMWSPFPKSCVISLIRIRT